jgi:hypothetical protein
MSSMMIPCAACGWSNSFDRWPGDVATCTACGAPIHLPLAPTVAVATETASAPRPETLGPEEVLAVGSLIGQYRIEGFIGRGGMGAVYAVMHTMLQRRAAMKILPPAFAADPEFVERFKREALALANLSHPNIVAIHDMGVQGTILYFVMEFVDGVSLRELIAGKRLPPEEALKLVPPLCEALEYAHAKGVVHRDIKPENILIDRTGAPKVADFGLAKLVAGDKTKPALTQTNIVMGTLDYMAPEQRDSLKRVDHRADIYSMGVVVYEMLTGELPIGRFEPPSRKAPVDMRMDEIVLKALATEPERRFQRASEMRTAMTGIVAYGAAPETGVPTVGLCLTRALEVWRASWGKLALASLIVSLPGLIMMLPIRGRAQPIFLAVGGLLSLFVAIPMTGGFAMMYLNALQAADRRARLRDLLRGFRRFFALAVESFISSFTSGFAAICLVLPGILLGTRWMFGTYYVMDRGMGPIDALRASWKLTSGAAMWHHVGLYIFFVLFGMLPSFAPVVGWAIALFTQPIGSLVVAYAYLHQRLK